jgi:hypothetical protein
MAVTEHIENKRKRVYKGKEKKTLGGKNIISFSD